MAQPFNIIIGEKQFHGIFNECPTARSIYEALPIESKANTWGDEIYFTINLSFELEPGASATVQKYDLAYWPPGKAFCIFFGQTPASVPGEIRAASEVTVVGHIEAKADELRKTASGTPIRLDKSV